CGRLSTGAKGIHLSPLRFGVDAMKAFAVALAVSSLSSCATASVPDPVSVAAAEVASAPMPPAGPPAPGAAALLSGGAQTFLTACQDAAKIARDRVATLKGI